MMNPLPSVTQAFYLIKQDEKQRQGYLPPNSDGTSFYVSGNAYASVVQISSGNRSFAFSNNT